MNQLISKISKQKILSLVLVLMFLVPLMSFAATGENTAPVLGGPANIIQGLLYTIVNSLFGWMVWASGLLLNYSVKEYVVGFGFNFIDSGLGSAVNNLWVTVRDIFNLTFIFGLVYIGFKMILNSGDSNARRMLVSLILAALLVNFSLFITKTVIDFSNIAATQFAASFSSGTGTEVNYDLTDKFMQLTGLSSLWGSANKVADMPAGQGWAYIFGSLILYLVMAFVFAAGAILLIIRYVVLNIYMILSPIMFLGWVFPGFSGASQKYWSGFLQRAFFAPAYLLMLFFAAEVLKAMSFPNQDLANAFVNSGAPAAKDAFIATIPYFILTCAFLIAAIVVAQKMGAVGATNAIAIGNRLRGTAQRAAGSATFGLAAYGLRNTAGALGNAAISNNNRYGQGLNKAAQGSGVKAWAARRAQDIANKSATSSYDGRRVSGMGKAAGIGEGKDGGFAKQIDERAKKEKARAKKYAYNDQAYDDYGVRDEFDEYTELTEERDRVFEELAQTEDQNARMLISARVRDLQAEVETMERSGLTPAELAILNPQQQAARTARLREFNNARTAASANYGQRLYAANLATRYDNLPYIGGTWATESQERNNAAAEINREAGRNPQERILRDILANQNQPAPNPANP